MTVQFASSFVPLGTPANFLRTSDLNGDGNLDLISSYFETSNQFDPSSGVISQKSGLMVLLGDGSGQFGAVQKYPVEQTTANPLYQQQESFLEQQYQQQLQVYEQQRAFLQQQYDQQYQQYLNLLSSFPPGTLIPPPLPVFPVPPVRLPNTFSPETTVTSPVQSLALADVDRDGRLDAIALGSTSSVENQNGISLLRQKLVLAVLKSNGMGGFSPAAFTPINNATGFASDFAIGDFNGDGAIDIAVIGGGGSSSSVDPALQSQVSILLGNGSGQFGREQALPIGNKTTSIATGDFNGDGRADLAVGYTSQTYSYSGSSRGVTILLADGRGGFSSTNVGGPSSDLEVGDFNGDSKLDLLVENGYLPGDGTGNFGTYVYASFGQGVQSGDFNGDGKLDFAYAGSSGYEGSKLSVLLGSGTGRYSLPLDTISLPGFSSGSVVGDFNRDGKPDVALLAVPSGLGSSTRSTQLLVALNRTTSTEALVVTSSRIDASVAEGGGLIVDLSQKTLQLGSIRQTLSNSYRFVRGTVQSDRIAGSNSKDSLDGIDGNDVLLGRSGNDTLAGGLGKDTLTGGKGKDEFGFANGSYADFQFSPFTRSLGVDKITDFELGKDKIILYRDTFTAFPKKRISFATVDNKLAAQKSKALIAYIPQTGSLFYNANGAKPGFGEGGLFADLANGLTLTGRDFKLN